MVDALTELIIRWEGAAECLKLLVECGASNAAIDVQREHTRALRLELEAMTPDGFHDCYEGNVVAHIA